MRTKIQIFTLFLAVLTAGCITHGPAVPVRNIDQTAKSLSAQANDLNPKVVRLALRAYNKAQRKGRVREPVVTIIDYSKSSIERRFYVLDLEKQKVMYEELVSHGKNSGDLYPRHFSNRPGSLQSSIGVFVTAEDYYHGHYGYSLRLHGLDRGFNEAAYKRALVIHGASYVNETFAKQNGGIGLTFGCPALDSSVVKPVIDEIKGGSLVFAYYPDKRWLKSSEYLRM